MTTATHGGDAECEFIKTARLTLAYDTFGDASNPAILLIMGFSTQMIVWPEHFCRNLAEQGFYVIRFDNRDVGLSEKFEHLGHPSVGPLIARRFLGLDIPAPYSLEDMAADAVSLLDGLNIERAHVVGMSMGGMIGQLVAIGFPERIRSLTSWSSSAGRTTDLILDPVTTYHMLQPVAHDPEERVENSVEFWDLIGSPAYPTPADETRQKTWRSIRRTPYVSGNGRQFAAIVSAPSRIKELRSLNKRTMVIHGTADRLVPFRAGKAVAKAIPNADFHAFKGYGHDLPDQLLPVIAQRIAQHARRAC